MNARQRQFQEKMYERAMNYTEQHRVYQCPLRRLPMRIFQSILKIPATTLWNLSEWSGIGLGRFAPFVFGLMIGSKPLRKVE